MEETDTNKKRIEDLAKLAEESYEDMVKIFDAVMYQIKTKQPHLPEVKLINQTIGSLKNHYNKKNKKKAEKQIFIPFGVFSEAKDMNKVMRDSIYKEWSDPRNHPKMIAEGKIFTMKIGEKTINGKIIDEKVAIKAGASYKTTDVKGIKIVTEGTPWKPGDQIIPRNYPEKIKYGTEFYDNWNQGEELSPSWKTTLFGIGFYDGTNETKIKDPDSGAIIKKSVQKNIVEDGVICYIDFTGDYADPNSPKFILKQPIWFNLGITKTINQKFSNELFIQSRAKVGTGIDLLDSDKLKLLDYEENDNLKQGIISRINERVSSNARKLAVYITTDSFKAEPKNKQAQIMSVYKLYEKFVDGWNYIPVIDLIGINDFHLKYRALRDEKGNIKKTGAWDDTDLRSFAICECSYTGMYAPTGKPPKLVITDTSLPNDRSLFCKFPNGFDIKMPEGQAIVSLSTSRGNQRYDLESGEYIEDPENAVAIPKVKGIKLLFKFDDIDVDKILADL